MFLVRDKNGGDGSDSKEGRRSESIREVGSGSELCKWFRARSICNSLSLSLSLRARVQSTWRLSHASPSAENKKAAELVELETTFCSSAPNFRKWKWLIERRMRKTNELYAIYSNLLRIVDVSIAIVCWEFTHRVKSVSMAKFTSQEVTALQEGGNKWKHQLAARVAASFGTCIEVKVYDEKLALLLSKL